MSTRESLISQGILALPVVEVVLDMSTNPVWIVNEYDVVLFCNSEASRLFGFTQNDLRHCNVLLNTSVIFCQFGNSTITREHINCKNIHKWFNKESSNFMFSVKSKKGEVVNVQASVKKIDKNVNNARSIFYVFTFYPKDEILPLYSLKSIINGIQDPCLLLDSENLIYICNEAVCKMFGYREENLVGKHFNILKSVDSILPESKAISELKDVHELTLRCNNGDVIGPLNVTFTPCSVEGKTFSTLHFEDIRNLRTREEQAAEAYSWLAQTMHVINDPIFVADEFGIIRFANSAACEIFGYEKEQLVGENISIIMPDDVGKGHDAIFGKYRKMRVNSHCVGGKHIEVNGKKSDGTLFPMMQSVVDVTSSNSNYFVASIHDLSAIKEREEKLGKANQKLEHANQSAQAANRVKSIFLSKMSHKINTPLNGISSAVDTIISEQNGLNKEHYELLEAIKQCSESLKQISSGMLNSARLDHVRCEEELFSLKDLLNSFSTTIKGSFNDINIIIEEVYKESKIWGEPPLLEHVMKSTIQYILDLPCMKNKKKRKIVLISVSEIDKDEKKREVSLKFTLKIKGSKCCCRELDAAFKKIHSNSVSHSGLGFCQNIIDSLGGTFWKSEEKNEKYDLLVCVNFSVDFRIERDNIPPIKIVRSQKRIDDKISVLIVDDIKLNRKFLVKWLSDPRYYVEQACNGLEAVEKAANHFFDVIFMDVHMPVLDGIAATRQILEGLSPDSPPYIIGLTADPAKEIECRDAGMIKFMCKPYNKQKVVKACLFYGGKSQTHH